MKKLIILMSLSMMSGFVFAQKEHSSLNFSNSTKWESLATIAKERNKLLFIDFYATWCGPCKKMDLEVYPDSSIANYFNRNFISIKLQTDKTKNDDNLIRQQYEMANDLTEKYKITTLPTLLFITPNGEIIDRLEGYQTAQSLLEAAKKALDPNGGYLRKKNDFIAGKLPIGQLLDFSLIAKKIKDDSIGSKASKAYIKYLNIPSQNLLAISKNLDFLYAYAKMFRVNDSVVTYVYRNQRATDSVFKQSGFSQKFVDFVINYDLISPKLWPNGKISNSIPNWNLLTNEIKEKFDQATAKRVVVDAQIRWYGEKKDWDNTVKYNIEKIQTFGLDTTGMGRFYANNMFYDVVFKHSKSIKFIKVSIGFMKRLIKIDPHDFALIDTYANLLYKSGQKKKALIFQNKALKLAEEQKDQQAIDEFLAKMKKMKGNEPTWL